MASSATVIEHDDAEPEWGVDSGRAPRQGDVVEVVQGATITGTHPSLPKAVGKTYRVTVHAYDEYEGVITWVGTGGYWHGTIEWRWPTTRTGRSTRR